MAFINLKEATPPPKYWLEFADGSTVGTRTHSELVGQINERNKMKIATRSMVMSALAGNYTARLQRVLDALQIKSITKMGTS